MSENDTYPDPEFLGMSFFEITEVLDEIERESREAERERDYLLSNKWSPYI